MARQQALHAAVASNGACRRRPVIVSAVNHSHRDKNRPVKLIREIELVRNPKTGGSK